MERTIAFDNNDIEHIQNVFGGLDIFAHKIEDRFSVSIVI